MDQHPSSSWTDNFRSPAALARFLLVMAIGLGLDLWTKVLAETHLRHADPIRFIPGWLHFTYTENRGAVFGIGQGQRPLFLVVSVLAIGFLSYLFATSGRQRFYQFVLGMLLAGVLGNLYDRYHYGHVRDMIHALPRWPNAFPWIFNIADCLLCVGVFFMLVYSFFFAPPGPKDSEPASSDEMTASAP
jgi:signal peptidase II